MKFDSPLFDKIRVKPDKDRSKKNEGPACEWAGCKEKASHRAPKGRGRDKDYWSYCIAHVRQYNQNYNFFNGMNDDQVRAYQKDALTGHRPTWKMGTGKRSAKADMGGADDMLGVFEEIHGRSTRGGPSKKSENKVIRNVERRALEVLGLDIDATPKDVKARFKELVKRHHPDANGGDRSSEDRLVEIIQSYNYLKTAGFG